MSSASSFTTLSGFSGYVSQVLRYRHFWVHLALSDLRARFRRSYLGIFWITIQPLVLTIIMSMVFIFVFHQSFMDYSIYLFSGLVTWNFITNSFTIGGNSYILAEGYMRQVRLPSAIYPLKATLYCCIVFTFEFLGFMIYSAFVKPEIFSWHWIFILPFLCMMILLSIPVAIISAIVNIKFRDFQQLITVALQMLIYASPIMLVRSVFDHPGLHQWTRINPVAALVDILREPLINGNLPPLEAYGTLFVWAALVWALALRLLRRNERKIVFYY
jgi:lipopolysaccharide transport system permease protein